MDYGAESGPVTLREDLLDLLRNRQVRQSMNQALIREATGEAKTTGVIRAYELVQKIIQEAGENAPPEELDLRQFSDCQLRRMMARIRRDMATEGGAAEKSAARSTEGGTAAGDTKGHTARDTGGNTTRDAGDGAAKEGGEDGQQTPP